MKEEDIDWQIYHLIAKRETIGIDELVSVSGMDAGTVNTSVERLQRYLLIERSGNSVRVLSIGESLLKNQVQHAPGPGLEMIDGVIRVREEPDARK